MVLIGIDASFRSTGITVLDDKDVIFYIITPHITKKQASDPLISYVEYDKTEDKTGRINNYISVLQEIIKRHNPDTIVIEDVPYMSRSSSVVDLALLNGAIRTLCHFLNIPCIAVGNTVWKKATICVGNAEKDFVVLNFIGLQPQFSSYTTKQINDIADSFFIAKWYAWGGQSIGERVEIIDE